MNATATAVQPKERPILFSGSMVRAILDGRKTQTRRVIKPQPIDMELFEIVCNGKVHYRRPAGHPMLDEALATPGYSVRSVIEGLIQQSPYGKPGDRLWVREAFAGNGTDAVWYREGAEYPNDLIMKWKPSIHMPRWASRITLEITEVRVERLQEISKDDAIAEGVRVLPLQETTDPSAWYESAPGMNQSRSAEECYRKLWDSINADRGFGWDTNPWVWAISFKRVQQ